MKQTMAQKILARASGRKDVNTGEYITAKFDLAIITTTWREVHPILTEAGVTKLFDTDKIIFFIDHRIPVSSVIDAEHYKGIRENVKKYKIKTLYDGVGICHAVAIEKGHVLPGMLIVGNDSHTPIYGALGAAGTGIGNTEIAYAATAGEMWFMVPETIKFNITGKHPRRVYPKDIMLYLAGKYTCAAAQYRAVEYSGPAMRDMDIAGRITLCNMALELGAKFGFVEPDDKVEAYLRNRARGPYTPVYPDPDAVYEKVYHDDVSSLEPQISLPHRVDNVKPISRVGEIKVHQAIIGSCANSQLDDLREAASVVKGKKINPDTRFQIIPGSAGVYRAALEEGILTTLLDAGAIICNPTCGPCYGGQMGLIASGENCIAAFNRNFQGRMGSPKASIYLGSPATVAASALEGKIADPRKY